MTLQPISAIASYHAHIYFRDEVERARAATLRALVAERFLVRIGSWHDQPVGPHDLPMYQIAFAAEVFSTFIPWLMLNRQDLVVLIHPNTVSPRRDHLVHAFWMGAVLPVARADQLPLEIGPAEIEPVIPNTHPTQAL